MMRDVLLFAGLLLFQSVLFSQNTDPAKQNSNVQPIEKQYDSFRNTFDKETNSSPDKPKKQDRNKTVSNLQPFTLPDWVTNFQVPDQENMILTLGISDPGLDSANATKQAIIRAKGLLTMFCESTIQNITDSYTNQYQGSDILGKYTSFSKIEPRGNFPVSAFKIFKKEFTSFGEAVVLAGIPKSACNSSYPEITVKAEYFLSEEGEYDNPKIYGTYCLLISDDEGTTADFTAHKTKKSILVTTTLNGDSLAFDYGKFKYFSESPVELSDDELLEYSTADLTNGLWNAWFAASLRQMEMAEKHTSEIRKMDDNYTSKYQNLTREVSENQLGFKPARILIKDNIFYLKMTQIK